MVNTEAETPETRNRRKVRLGIVTSDKMDKTIVVTVTNLCATRFTAGS
jgi:ribosomal protein S17